ncbi:hypothetical protein A8M58_08595 [Yersinia pestis]|nr:hypothetical protein A8M58_08595 [Yersinia pestis]
MVLHIVDSKGLTLYYVFNADGNELLNLDIIGSKKQAGQEWVFPISGYGGENSIFNMWNLKID